MGSTFYISHTGHQKLWYGPGSSTCSRVQYMHVINEDVLPSRQQIVTAMENQRPRIRIQSDNNFTFFPATTILARAGLLLPQHNLACQAECVARALSLYMS